MKYLVIGLLLLMPQLSTAAGIIINDEIVQVGGIRIGEDGSVQLPGISIGGNGSVDIDTEDTDIDINEDSTHVNTSDDYPHPAHRPQPKNGRTLITDGVFFDESNKAHNVKTGKFNRLSLSDIDLSYYDLSGADFSRTTLDNVSFAGADLTGANFHRAKFKNVDFTGAMLAGVCLTRNTFEDTLIINADVTDAIFARYEFKNTSFEGTNKGAAQWLESDDCYSLKDYKKRAGHTIIHMPAIKPVHSSIKRQPVTHADNIIHQLSQGTGTKIDLTVNFNSGSADLYGNAYAQISEIAKALKSPALRHQKILIEGHTDSEGSERYNLDLSYQRASTVERILKQQHGIDWYYLTIKGFGESVPVADNHSDYGRSMNRRVTLVRL